MSNPSAARAARSAVPADVTATVARATLPHDAAPANAAFGAADELETTLQLLGWLSAQFRAIQLVVEDHGPSMASVRLQLALQLAEAGQHVSQTGENNVAYALEVLRKVAK